MPAKTKKKQKRLTMNASQFSKLLKVIYACQGARIWCRGKSFHQAWNTCRNEMWMYWFLLYAGGYTCIYDHYDHLDKSLDEIRRRFPSDRVLRKVIENHGASIGL